MLGDVNRKRSEQTLQESEERFRQLADASSEGILIHDGEKVLDANQRYADMFGYSFSEVIGKNVLDFVAPDSREIVSKRIHEEYDAPYEAWEMRKDGITFPAEVAGRKTSFMGKSVRVAVIRDITQRKMAEEEIRRSESEAKKLAHENAVMAEIGRIISSTLNIEEVYERFAEKARELIAFDRISISVVDQEKGVATPNYTAGVPVPGYHPGDTIAFEGTATGTVIRMKESLLFQTEDENEVSVRYPSFLAAYRAGLRSAILVPLISKDRPIGVLYFRSKVPNAYTDMDVRIAENIGHQIAGALANALLFAERKRMEEEIQLRAELLDAAPDSITVHDIEGNFIYANRAACEMHGYSKEELLAAKVPDLVAPEYVNLFVPWLEKIQKRGKATFESDHLRKDGTIVPVEIYAKMTDWNGEKVVLSIHRDITKRKLAERALRESEEEAKRLATENATMAELGRIISSTLNIENVYEGFAEKTRELISFDRISIMIADRQKSTVTVSHVAGLPVPERQPGAIIPLEGTAVEAAIQTRKGFLLQTDDENEVIARFPAYLFAFRTGFRSIISVPLISGNEVIGVLNFFSKKIDAYRDLDLSIAKSVGNQIAGAIANALLYEERKRAEKELERREKEIRLIAENIPALVSYADADGVCRFVNKEYERWFGLPRTEAIGKHTKEVIGEAAYRVVQSRIKTALSGAQVRFEEDLPYPNGTRWVDAHYVPDIAEDGGVKGYFALVTDITDRKQAEALLQKERERFFTILEHAPLGIVLIDKEGNYVYQNPEFSRLTGYSSEDIPSGRDWFQKAFPDEESRNRVIGAWKESRSSGGFAVKDFNVIRKDGESREMEFRTTFLTDGGAVTMVRDVTEIKRAEAELKNSREWLRAFSAHLQSALEEERKRIAREIHDELGQALTAVKMDVSWVKKKLPEDQSPLLEKIRSLSELLDSTIKIVKRITSDLRPGLLDDLGLAAAMEWQAEEFQNRTGIRCLVTIDPEEILMSEDLSTNLFRIFQEALTNVARHAKATKVRVDLIHKGDSLEMSVSDDGRGIKQKQKQKQKTVPQGFGLTGIRERVLPYGGEVNIISPPGEGTTIKVRIPIKQGEM